MTSMLDAKATRRGRPQGAKGKAETPALKRTREYLAYLDQGIRPFLAARKVAGAWQVSEHTVRKDAWRYKGRIVAERMSRARLVKWRRDCLAHCYTVLADAIRPPPRK